jgi:hypothetical protein
MKDTPIEATQKYVHDIEWPASKETVLAAMEQNGAPDDVLQNVRVRDQEKFVGPNDVHQALWVQA